MHAVKVSWVGQTFALAKSNDSGGKKSRIRRSKEERKSMVESFIKRYQESNNGNFPSLNLTHKEVGGSFYTVREIVREIIQENRVLGPAKFSEDPISDEFSEQYPLGSISTEPQSHLFFSPDNNFLISTDDKIVTKEVVSSSNLDFHFTSHEQQSFDNGRLINGKVVDEENNNMDATKLSENGQFRKNISDPSINMEVQVGEKLDEVKNVSEASVAKVTPIAAGIIVETFPLRTGAKQTFRIDENSETKVSTGSLKEVETTMVEVAPEINDDLFDVENKSSGSDDKLATEKTADPILESTVHTTIRTSLGSQDVDVPKNDILTLQTSDQCLQDAEIEPKVSPPEVHTKNFDAINSSSTGLESLQTEAAESKTKAHNQHGVSTNEGSTSTLNRINLRSWDSKKSAKEEINPVWAVFKSFIDAFVKFWSE